jgi:hypothetical protein
MGSALDERKKRFIKLNIEVAWINLMMHLVGSCKRVTRCKLSIRLGIVTRHVWPKHTRDSVLTSFQ